MPIGGSRKYGPSRDLCDSKGISEHAVLHNGTKTHLSSVFLRNTANFQQALLHYIIVHKYICTYISILCLVLHMKKGPMSSILTKITLIVSVKQLFSFFKMFSSLPSIKNFSKVFKKLWNNDEGFFFCIECCCCCLNVHVDAKKKSIFNLNFHIPWWHSTDSSIIWWLNLSCLKS